jgi:DNA-binding MarR family transcriptional regulator
MKMIEPNPLMYVHFDEGISLGQIQVEQLIKNSPIVLPAKDIITKTELSKATVFRALKKAQDRGLITKVNDKSGPGYKWTISYDDE